jgi:hypothetical protein
MKKNAVKGLICFLLMNILTGCSKEIYGVKLQWIGFPLLVILIAIVGVIIYKNYKSLAEEKQLIAEMARRQEMFAAEEAERQKQLTAEKKKSDS